MDWSRFSGHGIAVHDALIELVLPDAAKRTLAFQSLNQHMRLGGLGLRHVALPFLVRIASDARVEDRSQIIRFLNSLVDDPVVLASVAQNGNAFSTCLDHQECSCEALVLLASCERWEHLTNLLAGPPNDARTLAIWCAPAHLLTHIRQPNPIDQVILWLTQAQERELELSIRTKIEHIAADTFFSMHRAVEAADGFFPDLITRIQTMQPKTRWSILNGLLFGVEQGVAIDVLTSRMIDVFLPTTARSFEELPYEARAMVSRFVSSQQTWSGSQMQRTLKLAGLPHQRSKVVEELKRFGLVEVVVFLPELHPGAVTIAEQIAAPYWRGTPFLFFSGDTSQLIAQIPEDVADFPARIMNDSAKMAGWFYNELVHEKAPRLRHASQENTLAHYRFYPNESREALLRLCDKNCWRVVELSEAVHEEPSVIGDQLKSRGWQDVSCWKSELLRIFAKFCTTGENAWLSVSGDSATLALGGAFLHDCLMVELRGRPEDIIEVATTRPLRRADAGRLIELGKKKGLKMGLRLSKTSVIQF